MAGRLDTTLAQVEGRAAWDQKYSEILVEAKDGVGYVRLNRPQQSNAWTGVMNAEMRVAMFGMGTDPGIRCIVVTGVGKHFCAGADMGNLNSIGSGKDKVTAQIVAEPGYPFDNSKSAQLQSNTVTWLALVPRPVICAINGAVAGIGLCMTLFSDIRVCHTKSIFVTAFAQRGLIAEYGSSWMLPRIVGISTAMDWLMTSRRVPSEEALRAGFVSQVFSPDTFLEDVHKMASGMAMYSSPRSTRLMKVQVWDDQFRDLLECMKVADQEKKLSFKAKDFTEGVRSFMEKRPPRFTGE